MMMVEMHGGATKVEANSHNVTRKKSQSATAAPPALNGPASVGLLHDVTTQMMMNSESALISDPPILTPLKNNQSKILIWTDHEEKDIFSLVLKRRLAFLSRQKACPVLNECSFSFTKKGNDADTVVVAAKRHFPYGGRGSGKTWTLILPGMHIFLINCRLLYPYCTAIKIIFIKRSSNYQV